MAETLDCASNVDGADKFIFLDVEDGKERLNVMKVFHRKSVQEDVVGHFARPACGCWYATFFVVITAFRPFLVVMHSAPQTDSPRHTMSIHLLDRPLFF
jgi:hypothetical protein